MKKSKNKKPVFRILGLACIIGIFVYFLNHHQKMVEKQPVESKKIATIEIPVVHQLSDSEKIVKLKMPLNYLCQTMSGLTEDQYIGKDCANLVIAYKSIEKEMLYLDSIAGLQIDFIGITHSDYEISDLEVSKSQNALREFLKKNPYDIIGFESSVKQGFVNHEDLVNEASAQFQSTGMDHSRKHALEILKSGKENDVLQHMIEMGAPNIAGTEQREVYYLQLKIGYIMHAVDPAYGDLMQKAQPAFSEVRSAVAISRIARMMRKNKLKNAVIVYGRNHLPAFHFISEKFGLVSKFYTF